MKKINKRYYDIFMCILVIIVCAIMILTEFGNFDSNTIEIFNIIDKIIWGIFVIDYLVRFLISPSKIEFIKNNKIDLISIIPFNSLFKSLRIFKVFRLMKVSKMSKLLKVVKFFKFKARAEKFLKTNNFNYVIYITVITILLGAIGLSISENKSLRDSLWWSFVTTTTVGYGDISPSTNLGRIIASILMIVGIGFVGMLTGTIATFFLNNVVKENKTYKDEVIENIKLKLDDFDSITKEELEDICNVLISLKKE